MDTTLPQKKPLLVAAPDPHPSRGSEPGKAFQWAKALAEFYHIHFICCRGPAETCQKSGVCNDWKFHPVDVEEGSGKGIFYYRFYYNWCQRTVEKCLELIPEIKPIGLHHPSLGSFRMLPNYDRLGIPYTLGPLGGGETAPFRLLCEAGLPWQELAKELTRPVLNFTCLLNPQVRRVLQKARVVVATTPETERLLRGVGANAVTVFPDAVELPQSGDPMMTRREQTGELARDFRLIWAGRFTWWKGGQIVLRFMQRLRQNGVKVSLDIYSAGPGLEGVEQMAVNLGLKDSVRFNGLVPRDQLVQAQQRAHLFVFPSLHESGSSIIPEAYSTGLPSMTLALGGTSFPSDRNFGLNETPPNFEIWMAKGVELVKGWILDPEQWLRACQSALNKGPEFNRAALTERVRTTLVPCLEQASASPSLSSPAAGQVL